MSNTFKYRAYRIGKKKNKFTLTGPEFIRRATELHDRRYAYYNIDFNLTDPIDITCHRHGVFTLTIDLHLNKGEGCPVCLEDARKVKELACAPCGIQGSFGEVAIVKYLESKGIPYTREKTFDGCVNPYTGRHLRYDFYLPGFRYLIEFDGVQHYKPYSFGTDRSYETKVKNLADTQTRDAIKDKFAHNANLGLLRIHYEDLERIDSILDDLIAYCKIKFSSTIIRGV